MAGVGHSGMVEQMSEGARLRQVAGHHHQGKPLVVTDNSLLPRTVVSPSACTHCQTQSCPLYLLLAPELLLAPTPGAQLWPQSLGTISSCNRRL